MAIREIRPWVTVGFLLCAIMVSFLDRQVITVLVGPIRADFGITDFQIGLLTGPIFVVLYVMSGLPMGWAADRYHRPLLGGLGIFLWSAMTVLSGFAKNLQQLMAARTGVGIGEGALGPIAHSLLADSFTKARLPVAMGVVQIAGSLGIGLSLVLTGIVGHFLASHPLSGFAALNSLHQWQQVFIVVSLPGFVLAPLFALCVREPRRRSAPLSAAASSFQEVKVFWRARRRLIVLFVTGMAGLEAASYGALTWIPTLLMRVHGLSADQMGRTYGVMVMLVGASSTVFWGMFASKLIARGHLDGCLRAALIASAVGLPFGIIAPLMHDTTSTLALLVPSVFCRGAYNGLGSVAVQLITPTRLRGRIASLYIAAVGIPGLFIGPSGIGALTTYWYANDMKLGEAIAWMSGSMSLIGIVLWTMCLKPFRDAAHLEHFESLRRPLSE